MRSIYLKFLRLTAVLMLLLSANLAQANGGAPPSFISDGASVGQLVIKPVEGLLNVPPHMNGAQFKSYLDGVGNTLFGTTFPGLVLLDSPEQVNVTYSGLSAVGFKRFTFTTTKVDEIELIAGHLDPATGEKFDLRIVWVRGALKVGNATVSAGMLATTATYLTDPTFKLTFLLPLGINYPFNGLVQVPAPLAKGGDVVTLERGPREGLLDLTGELGSEIYAGAEEEDPCQDCYDDANRDLKRAHRDFKSCLKWSAVGGLGGALVGLFGGNPVTVIGGAALGAELVALNCAENYATEVSDIIEDFCACLAEHECPPHPICD